MTTSETNDLLNRILVLHARSLPMYLGYAQPDQLWKNPKAAAVLNQIVGDHKRTVDRLAALILDNHGTVDHGEFPMSFTGLHDLSVDYLFKQLIDRQKRFIAVIEKLAEQLKLAPYAQAAAREAVGEARGHLENLEELAADRAHHAA
jgi:hypothetical protein